MSDNSAEKYAVGGMKEHLDAQKEAEEMAQRYHNVFGTTEGRIVLGDILVKGHYGITLNPEQPVQVAEYNFALVIAHLAGLFNPLYAQLGLGSEKGEQNGR